MRQKRLTSNSCTYFQVRTQVRKISVKIYAIALPCRFLISSLVEINLASFVIPRLLFACFNIYIYSKLQ